MAVAVSILTPEGKVFEGDVYSVSAPGALGSFGVLEGIRLDRHAVLIEPGRRMLDKITVNETLGDNLPRYSVG